MEPDLHSLTLAATGRGVLVATLAVGAERIGPWLDTLPGWVRTGKIAPSAGEVLELAQAAEAHRILRERRNLGKVLLQV